jgi:hypothetical protein
MSTDADGEWQPSITTTFNAESAEGHAAATAVAKRRAIGIGSKRECELPFDDSRVGPIRRRRRPATQAEPSQPRLCELGVLCVDRFASCA